MHHPGRLRIAVSWGLWLSCASLAAHAQFQPSSSQAASNFTLAGTVSNALTGEPIPRALVTVAQQKTFTDFQGHFELAGVPAGEVFVTAQKPGFSTEEDLRQSRMPHSVHLEAGMAPITLRLVPNEVLSGRVVDENDEPIEGAGLRLVTRTIDYQGHATWNQQWGTSTDEEGQFRFGDLHPGSYFLEITGLPLRPPIPGVPASGFVRRFYPDAPSRTEASTIVIAPGQRQQVTFKVRSQPVFNITGTITGAAPSQSNAPSVLVHISAIGQTVAANPVNGTFRFLRVPAGTYELFAFTQGEDPLYGQAQIAVQRSIGSVVLSLEPGANLPIVVTVESDDSKIPPPSQPDLLVGQATLRAISSDEGFGMGMRDFSTNRGKPEQPLELKGVRPGQYRLESSVHWPWYIASARSGATDLLQEPLTVGEGGRAAPIDLLLRNDAGELDLQIAPELRSTPAVALLVPESWPMRPVDRRDVMPSSGNLSALSREITMFRSLPPGDYTIYFFDDIGGLEYGNPEALRSYSSGAQHFTIAPHQKLTLTLDHVIKRAE